MTKKVFISYAQDDPDFDVRQLAAALEANGYEDVWDKRFLSPGCYQAEEIKARIAAADVVLSVLTPCSVERPWIARELNEAILQECLQNRHILYPVALGNRLEEDKEARKELFRLVRNQLALRLWAEKSPLFTVQNAGDPSFARVLEALSQPPARYTPRPFTYFQMAADDLAIYRVTDDTNWSKNLYQRFVQTVDCYLLFDYPPSSLWKYFLACPVDQQFDRKEFLSRVPGVSVTGDGSRDDAPGMWRVWFVDTRCALTGSVENMYTNNRL